MPYPVKPFMSFHVVLFVRRKEIIIEYPGDSKGDSILG